MARTRLPLSGFIRVSLAVSSLIFVMALPARASDKRPSRVAAESQTSATLVGTDATAAAERQTTTSTSFEALSSLLERGHEVIVTDEAGRRLKGRISSISSEGLVLTRRRFRFSAPQERAFASEQVRTVQFVDSVWNGGLIGAAVSVGVLAIMIEADCSPSCVDNFGRPGRWVLGGVMMVPLGISIGRGLDSAINKAVYQQPGRLEVAISPVLGRDTLGVKARVRF